MSVAVVGYAHFLVAHSIQGFCTSSHSVNAVGDLCKCDNNEATTT